MITIRQLRRRPEAFPLIDDVWRLVRAARMRSINVRYSAAEWALRQEARRQGAEGAVLSTDGMSTEALVQILERHLEMIEEAIGDEACDFDGDVLDRWARAEAEEGGV